MKEIEDRINANKKWIIKKIDVEECYFENVGIYFVKEIYSKKIDNLITITQMLSMQKKVTKSDWNRFMKKLEEMK